MDETRIQVETIEVAEISSKSLTKINHPPFNNSENVQNNLVRDEKELIAAMRRYNAAKDTASVLLGYVADATGETAKQVFGRYGVNEGD